MSEKDTLSAEEREAMFRRTEEDVEFAVGPHGNPSKLALVARVDLVNLIRLAQLATPELIALGEAAVAYEEVRNRLTSPMSVAQRTARVDAELALTLAARAHAASVASIPSTTVGDNRT